jgi:hypothetical protein
VTRRCAPEVFQTRHPKGFRLLSTLSTKASRLSPTVPRFVNLSDCKDLDQPGPSFGYVCRQFVDKRDEPDASRKLAQAEFL